MRVAIQAVAKSLALGWRSCAVAPVRITPYVVNVEPPEVTNGVASLKVVPSLATVLASFPKLGNSVGWLLTGASERSLTLCDSQYLPTRIHPR